MTKKQFDGIVDCLVNVCTFNTSKEYSLSLHQYEGPDFFYGELIVFTNSPSKSFSTVEIELLLGLAKAWNVTIYYETMHGVTVARYL